MPPERSPFKSVPQVPSAHSQEVSASLPSLWLFSSFGLRERVISYVIFNGTSACAWINWVQTNRNIFSQDCSLKKHVWARFLAACNSALLFKWHNARSQAGQSLGHNCQTNSGLDVQFHYSGNYISPDMEILSFCIIEQCKHQFLSAQQRWVMFIR